MALPPAVAQLKLVSEKLYKVSTPQYKNGHMRKPVFSRRKLADIRKAVILSGRFWPNLDFHDRKPKREPKLPADKRKKAARLEKIAQNMNKMPRLVDEWKKKEKAEKKKQLSAADWLAMRFSDNYESTQSIDQRNQKREARKTAKRTRILAMRKIRDAQKAAASQTSDLPLQKSS